MKAQASAIHGAQENSSREKFIEIQAFLKKQEKVANSPIYHLKEVRKRTNKIQSQQKEGNNKDQRGDKKVQNNEQINESNNWFFKR